MTTWTTRHKNLLDDTRALLMANGYDFKFDVGTQGITKFYTKATTGYAPDWDEWDGELGEADLAFMVTMVLSLPRE